MASTLNHQINGAQTQKNYLNYIHNFRGIAILYIMIIHTVSAFDWSKSPQIEKALFVLLNNGSVLFVFIGGYLFQHLSGKYEVKKYLYTKLRFVVLPYILCSIPAIIYFVWFTQRWEVADWYYTLSKPALISVFYLTGHHLAPYWFMPMIFIFYLISPFLVMLDRSKKLYWLLPLLVLTSFIINRGQYPHINFMHFLSVFVIGMYFSRYKEQTMRVLSKNAYLCFSICLVFCFYLLSYFGVYEVKGYVEKLVLCTFFISLLYNFDHIFKNSFSFLANMSFGMYFIHSYYISVVKLLYKSKTGHLFEGGLFEYTIFTVAIVTFTSYSVYGFKKIFGKYSRYLIGS